MSTNGPQGGKSTASRRLDDQIAHGVCHDCAGHEELHRAATAAEAKADAIIAAIQHARDSGHDNVETKLLTEPVEVGL